MDRVVAAPFALLVERVIPHGQLAAVALPDRAGDAETEDAVSRAVESLHPEERRLAEALRMPRRLSFIGGRLAMRSAMTRVLPGSRDEPVLRTPRGAPALPLGVLGSVSHKRHLAVAVAIAPSDDVQTVGVDLEDEPTVADLSRPDLGMKILTSTERHLLAARYSDDTLEYRLAVRVRFALKEAVYKAIDPHVSRYVRFQEVEVFPEESGDTRVRLMLPEFARRTITVRGWYTQVDGHIVATATAGEWP